VLYGVRSKEEGFATRPSYQGVSIEKKEILMKDKKHLSDVVEKAMKDDSHGPSPWAQQSGVKIVINLGGPPPTRPHLPMKHNSKKLEHKKLEHKKPMKMKKRKPGVSGPMESALKEMY
jgi:hypothetical protein